MWLLAGAVPFAPTGVSDDDAGPEDGADSAIVSAPAGAASAQNRAIVSARRTSRRP
jgi:hypothetical protein